MEHETLGVLDHGGSRMAEVLLEFVAMCYRRNTVLARRENP
jgi:hypothetical protein